MNTLFNVVSPLFKFEEFISLNICLPYINTTFYLTIICLFLVSLIFLLPFVLFMVPLWKQISFHLYATPQKMLDKKNNHNNTKYILVTKAKTRDNKWIIYDKYANFNHGRFMAILLPYNPTIIGRGYYVLNNNVVVWGIQVQSNFTNTSLYASAIGGYVSVLDVKLNSNLIAHHRINVNVLGGTKLDLIRYTVVQFQV